MASIIFLKDSSDLTHNNSNKHCGITIQGELNMVHLFKVGLLR